MAGVFSVSKWIGKNRIVEKKTDYLSPSLQLRRSFVIEKNERDGFVCRILGLGCYSLFLNGTRVGDDILSPAFTSYDKRALYVEYDVGKYLKNGKNVVAVKLGDGFYNQTTENAWDFHTASWRDAPKLLLEIVSLGGKVLLASDTFWKVSDDGATFHNAIRKGEYYDARKEDGWKNVDYDDSKWQNAVIMRPNGGTLCKMEMPFIRECEKIPATKSWKTDKGYAFDFGKNISGYVSIALSGKAGNTVSIRYAERLVDGKLYNSNEFLKGSIEYETDKYTFKGEGVETWKPEFVYHGFQYVELIGLDQEPPLSALTAYFIHTDLALKGGFASDNDLLGWIFDAGVRSFLSNVQGFIQDCPHREKNGWTADAVMSCDHSVFLFDMKSTYRKILQDIVDAQRENGQLSGIAPTSGWGYNWGSGPAWDCALFYLPYTLYKETGDTTCLFSVYGAMKKYLRYADYFRRDGLVCYGLCDWGFIDAERSLYARMSNELSDSCYYFYMQKVCAEVAKMSGETDLAEEYESQAEKTRLAIIKKYVSGKTVDNGEQGALAIVLYFGIVTGRQANEIAAALVEKIKSDNYVFKVGILGMKALLNALSMYGFTDVAFKMVDRYDYPSYGFLKNQGATTLWEYFNGGGSRNHHMYSDVVNWIIRNVAGLQNKSIAYNEVALKPYFYADKCSCSAYTDTDKGRISFAWSKNDNKFEADIDIPEGVKAILVLQNFEPVLLKNGKNKISLYLS